MLVSSAPPSCALRLVERPCYGVDLPEEKGWLLEQHVQQSCLPGWQSSLHFALRALARVLEAAAQGPADRAASAFAWVSAHLSLPGMGC